MSRVVTLLYLFALTMFGVRFASAQVDVSTGGPATTYGNMKLAFDAINAGTHTGAIIIDITGAGTYTDPATPAVLNSSGEGATSYTSILIRPTADGVVITGTSGAGRGVIELNGADSVTIDGDNPNTPGNNRNLTIQNLTADSITYASVVRVATTNVSPYETADNITIKNLNLTGNVSAGNASGITSTTSSANASFGIIVGPNGGAGISAITSVTVGMTVTAPQPTVNNLLVDNNVVNECGRAIVFLGGNANSSTGVTISNNTIGTAAVLAGSPPYTTPATTVYMKGIHVAGTTAITITSNTVQSILSYIPGAMSGIELITGIGSGPITIQGNTVSGVVMNGGSSNIWGITVQSAAGSYTVSMNTVTNIQSVGSNVVQGINLSTAAPSATVQLNTVSKVYKRGVSTNGGAYGINLAGGSSITVQNNFVSDINAFINHVYLNPAAGPHGIRIQNGLNHKIYHNSVNLSGPVLGMGGGPALASAFTMTVPSLTGVDVRNNSFANTLTGTDSSTAVACVTLPSGATSAMNLTWNNNAYFQGSAPLAAIGQVGIDLGIGVYLAADFDAGSTTSPANLRNYTSSLSVAGTNDNSSFATTAAAPYISATNLHVSAGTLSSLESTGSTTTVTTDIDGQVRPGPAGSIHGGALAPDIGADEFDGIPLDMIAPAISYDVLMRTAITSNRNFSGVEITDPSGINTTLGTRPRVYYKRSTDANALFGNTSGTNGWKYVESNGTTSPFDFTIDYSLLNGGTGVTLGDTVQYFVVAQDLATTPNVAVLSGIFPVEPTSVALTSSAFPLGGTINQYVIVQSLSGSVTVGTSGTYPSLTGPGGLFADINTKVLTGNLTASIISNISEPGIDSLNLYAEDGVGNYSVRIVPDAPVLRTIESTTLPDSAALITLNGAKRVVFDGRFNGSGQWLLFRAAKTDPTYGGSTFEFINEATDDTVRYCRIENNSRFAKYASVLISSASIADLSTNISIDHCILSDPTGANPGAPQVAISSKSSKNSNFSITNNEILNWQRSAISLTAGSNCTISNNDLYRTLTDTVSSTLLFMNATGGGHTISGNSIGGSAADRNGNPIRYYGGSGFTVMYFSLGSAPSSIQGNTLGNISMEGTGSALTGIAITAGSFPQLAITGNIIGGASVTGNPADTIGLPSGAGFYGISCTNTGGTLDIENNTISNVTANPATSTMQAIVASGSYPKTIRNNVIRDIRINCSATGTPTTFSTPCGILTSGGASLSDAVNIGGNQIFNITNVSGLAASNFVGLYVTSPRGVTIQSNRVYDLHATATGIGINAPLMWGMYMTSSTTGSMTVKNNMIALGSSGEDVVYTGIEDAGNVPGVSGGYYFNSIVLGGSATGTNNTYAFNRSGIADLTVVDNILSNTRAGGTGSHFAIANTNAAATGWDPSSSNYNDLYSSTPGSIGQWLSGGSALGFAAWKVASGGDAQSVSVPVTFLSTVDLHVDGSVGANSLIKNKGTSVGGVTADYDGELRTATPDIGADEFALPNSVSVPLTAGWNLISNPIMDPTPNDSVRSLYPTSSFPYGFAFDPAGGYVQNYTMSHGSGYWGKFPAATTNTIAGFSHERDTIDVLPGWNIVGTISDTVDTASVVSIPPGLRGSSWFGYAGGYTAATQLVPGKGYWVKATSAGRFILVSPSIAAPNRKNPSPGSRR